MKHFALWLYLWLTLPFQMLFQDLLERIEAAAQDAARAYRALGRMVG